MNHFFKCCFSLVMVLLYYSAGLKAQNHLFQTYPDSITQITVKFIRPDFSSPFTDLKFFGGVYEANLNMPIHPKYNIDVSIPFVNSSFEEFEAERGLGNISLALQRVLKDTVKEQSSVMLRIFGPTSNTDKDYLSFGLFTNYHDYAKYIGEAVTVHLNYAHSYNVYKGFYLEAEIGPSVVIDVGDFIDESELLIRYGIAAMYDFNSFNVRAEFNGEGILTESDVDDKFYQSFSLGAQLTQGNFQPGIFYNRFLDDNFSTSTNGVLGLIFNLLL